MGEVFGGRYELVDSIGAGGAGTVWRVWDAKEQRYRAAKLLKQSDAASLLRFIRETGYRIDHPHIVAPQSWVSEDDRILLAMDLANGGSVSTVLKDHGPLPDWWALIALDQLLEALEAIHDRGLIHRDIKPANLLLQTTSDGLPDVRLADFGIASHTSDPRLTHTTEVVGTPGYLSELARMGIDPQPSQDLYAAACVLAEMLTGRRPREVQPPVDLTTIAPDIRAFIEQLWRDSGTGFASAADARRALRTLRATQTPSTAPVEVFNQLGPLPEGFGADGPVHALGGSGPSAALSAWPQTAPTFTGPQGGRPSGGSAYTPPTGSHPVSFGSGTPVPAKRVPTSVTVLGVLGVLFIVAAIVLVAV